MVGRWNVGQSEERRRRGQEGEAETAVIKRDQQEQRR